MLFSIYTIPLATKRLALYSLHMNSTEIVDILRDGIFVQLLISAPPMIVALGVGLAISLLQALTQIQEATLTFVPKIAALLLTLILAFPFMFDALGAFGIELYTRIANIE